VIQHIVIVKWKAGTTEEQVLEACGKAGHMPNEIDGVQRITVGRNRGESDHGFTHALIVQLADENALSHYLAHPVRKRYLADHLDPIVDQRIEVDVPADLVLDRERLTSWYWGVGAGMGALPPEDD
jgi:Stress responsive A/B Barrel Domain